MPEQAPPPSFFGICPLQLSVANNCPGSERFSLQDLRDMYIFVDLRTTKNACASPTPFFLQDLPNSALSCQRLPLQCPCLPSFWKYSLHKIMIWDIHFGGFDKYNPNACAGPLLSGPAQFSFPAQSCLCLQKTWFVSVWKQNSKSSGLMSCKSLIACCKQIPAASSGNVALMSCWYKGIRGWGTWEKLSSTWLHLLRNYFCTLGTSRIGLSS